MAVQYANTSTATMGSSCLQWPRANWSCRAVRGKDGGLAKRLLRTSRNANRQNRQGSPRAAGPGQKRHVSCTQALAKTERVPVPEVRGACRSLDPAVTCHLSHQYQLNPACPMDATSWVVGGRMSDATTKVQRIRRSYSREDATFHLVHAAIYLRKNKKRPKEKVASPRRHFHPFFHSFICPTNIYGLLPKMCQASSKPLASINEINKEYVLVEKDRQ